MLVTDAAAKRRVLWAAVRLLEQAGLDVKQSESGDDSVTLKVVIPPDVEDMHGARLRAAVEGG